MSVAFSRSTSGPCLYPFQELYVEDGYPSSNMFKIISTKDGRGEGVASLQSFRRGQLISRVSGHLLSSRRLHTLQINAQIHMYDPYFTGLLLHSCAPNTFLDMDELELWALQDIAPDELLTMDYASTEDFLMRQFPCQCGQPNCRGWITGAKELPNQDGQLFLQNWQKCIEA